MRHALLPSRVRPMSEPWDRTKFIAWTLYGVLALGVSGCATFNQRSSSFESSLNSGQLAQALNQLDQHSQREKKNALLFELNRGFIYRLQNQYQLSNESLEQAKVQMEAIMAVSLSQQTLASAINDEQRSYLPHGFEQIYLHVIKILNYLDLRDLDSARVEVLRLDLTLNRLNGSQSIPAQYGFPRYLSGVVFEMTGESDQALVAYRKAQTAYAESGQRPPDFLILDLIRLAEYLGLQAEKDQWQQKYAIKKWTPQHKLHTQGELLVLFTDGLAPLRTEVAIQAIDARDHEFYRISIPRHQARIDLSQAPRYRINQGSYTGELMTNMNQIAEQTLSQQLPAITARAVARVAIKHRLVKESTQEAPLIGLLANVATAASERADTRTWSSLPSGWWALRLPLEAGEYTLNTTLGSLSDTRSVSIQASQIQMVVHHRLGPISMVGN